MEEKLNTQTPDEILRKKQQEMSNEELAEKVDKAVSDMCKSGVKTFRMSIPPSVNDTDMLISELVRRFKEGNRLIADSPFSNDNLRNSIKIDCLNFSEEYAYSNLRYHSSWDWLMPCIGKISNQCDEPEELDGLKYALLTDNIEEAWKFVVNYLTIS